MKAWDKNHPKAGLMARKQAAILGAARREFLAKGFGETTMAGIAAAAGVSRKTCTNYFRKKRDIAAALGDELELGFAVVVEQVCEQQCGTAERIVGIFSRVAETLLERPALYRGLIYETVAGGRERADRRRRMVATHESLAKVIREGIERGDVRRDLGAEAAGEIASAVFIETLVTWIVEPQYPLAERLRGAAAFLGEALAPREASPGRPVPTPVRDLAFAGGPRPQQEKRPT